jgi:hypothetical protein
MQQIRDVHFTSTASPLRVSFPTMTAPLETLVLKWIDEDGHAPDVDTDSLVALLASVQDTLQLFVIDGGHLRPRASRELVRAPGHVDIRTTARFQEHFSSTDGIGLRRRLLSRP